MQLPPWKNLIRVFEQNTDIIKFWLFYSVTTHEYSIIYLFLLANSYEPLVVLVSVLIHVIYKNWGASNFQRKVDGEFMWNSQRPPALIENPKYKVICCYALKHIYRIIRS